MKGDCVTASGEYSQLFRRLESLGADVVVRESQLHGVVGRARVA